MKRASIYRYILANKQRWHDRNGVTTFATSSELTELGNEHPRLPPSQRDTARHGMPPGGSTQHTYEVVIQPEPE